MPEIKFAPYRMFEYEMRLAVREKRSLEKLANQSGTSPHDALIRRGTYFSTVNGVPTDQSTAESLHHERRGSRASKQATRFLVHGLHEYKGKFNPQLARALVNTIDPAAESLLDPFCGSGTTLIEGMRLGLTVGGIDQNPLAAWISQVKTSAQRLEGQQGLVARFDYVSDQMRRKMKEAQDSGEYTVPQHVSETDRDYLLRWFPADILAALWAGLAVSRQEGSAIGAIAEVCLSNIVREVSWQLPEDLRVRRRPKEWTPPNVAEVFADAAERGRLALQEIEEARPTSSTEAHVKLGSSRDPATVSSAWGSGRRLVVTSPPYATALPYIDTDRLSIVLLGLAGAQRIRGLEQALTGSREWNTSESREWETARQENSSDLPSSILDLLCRIERSNAVSNAGFRRAAVPTLLYRYFTHIGETLSALSTSMNPGEHVVMVTGENRTGTGSQQIAIPTPELLGKLSESHGFTFSESIPLQTWARFALHSKNSVNVENAVVMTVKD